MSALSYFKRLGVKVLDKLPPLWRIKEGTTTQPCGYVWVDNSKPIFIKDSNGKTKVNPEYEQALLKL